MKIQDSGVALFLSVSVSTITSRQFYFLICWSSTDVDCRNPENVENGKVTLASNATYYGALALYACDKNFELDGVSRRLCLENGTWSSDTPACRGTLYPHQLNQFWLTIVITEIQCKDPDSLEGMSFKVSTHSVGGIAVYSCPRGYIMQGNSTRSCLKKGVWSGQSPSCTGTEKKDYLEKDLKFKNCFSRRL